MATRKEDYSKWRITNRFKVPNVHIRFTTPIFKDIITGKMNKYQIKILLFVLHNKVDNVLNLSKAIGCPTRSYEVGKALDSLKNYKIIKDKLVYEEGFEGLPDHLITVKVEKIYHLIDDNFRPTQELLAKPCENMIMNEVAYRFCIESIASAFKIRLLLVCISLYRYIDSMQDIQNYLEVRSRSERIREYLKLFIEDMRIVYSENLKKVLWPDYFWNDEVDARNELKTTVISNDDKRKERKVTKEIKENNSLLKNKYIYNKYKLCGKAIISPKGRLVGRVTSEWYAKNLEDNRRDIIAQCGLTEEIYGNKNKPEVINMNSLCEALQNSVGFKKSKRHSIPKNNRDVSVEFSTIRSLDKATIDAINNHTKAMLFLDNYNPFIDAPIDFTFDLNGKRFRIYNPLYEMKKIIDKYDELVSGRVKKAKNQYQSRVSSGTRRMVSEFYFRCFNSQIDPILFLDYLNENLWKGRKSIAFREIISKPALSLMMKFHDKYWKEYAKKLRDIADEIVVKKEFVKKCIKEDSPEEIERINARKELLLKQRKQILEEFSK
ncbi:hypothetical protein M0R01_03880 [bacterium]|nr:hypothetical protein [bacterium]